MSGQLKMGMFQSEPLATRLFATSYGPKGLNTRLPESPANPWVELYTQLLLCQPDTTKNDLHKGDL
jgi:hypothetical protein